MRHENVQGQTVPSRVSAARARLILDRPFLGSLVLRLPLQVTEATWCPTTATDARKLYFNPAYLEGLSLSQIEFALAHEALHCALAHFARRRHRDQHRWDIACDFAINPLLIEDGLSPPPDVLYLADYAGLSAEEIYPLLKDTADQQPHDKHLYDSDPADQQGRHSSPPGTVDPSEVSAGPVSPPHPLSATERAHLEQQWRERLASAAQQAWQAGRLSGSLARMVDELLAPAIPWRSLLARYMSMQARDDFHYARPARREGDAILPSLRSSAIDVFVAVDTSGSICTPEITQFVSEIDALKGQVSARITLLACDAQLSPDSPWVFEPWESLSLPEGISGGGGTDFSPVFDWAGTQDALPELLVYFTDAQGRFPPSAPPFPVLWLVKGPGQVPWGERIQLN